MGGGQVRSRALGEPADQPNDALVLFLTFYQGGAIVGLVRLRAGVDRQAGAVGSGIEGDVACVDIVIFDKMRSKPCLAEVDRNFIVRARPLKVGTEEPVNISHEIDRDETQK